MPSEKFVNPLRYTDGLFTFWTISIVKRAALIRKREQSALARQRLSLFSATKLEVMERLSTSELKEVTVMEFEMKIFLYEYWISMHLVCGWTRARSKWLQSHRAKNTTGVSIDKNERCQESQNITCSVLHSVLKKLFWCCTSAQSKKTRSAKLWRVFSKSSWIVSQGEFKG